MRDIEVRVQVEHPLVCLNQHPEHQWEDSGLHIVVSSSREIMPTEFCSRPGCGLIRVRQQREVQLGTKLQADPRAYTEALEKAQSKVDELVCSKCGKAHANVECPAVAEPCITCGRPAVVQTWEMVYSPKSKNRVKLVSYHCQEHAPKNQTGELPQPGDPYPEVRCERCQCLTPVSELSRDAQGRMVCKHH